MVNDLPRRMLPIWQRLLITVVVMLVASFAVNLAWESSTGYVFPSYLAGAVGGLAALPVWDLLKRIHRAAPEV